jgi:hypothetical protein
MDYRKIKELAKQQGIKVSDLCALAPQNDPFYVGQPAQKVAAQWFARMWESLGFSYGAHLRRVHYAIVSQNLPVSKPNSEPYLNIEEDWNFLCNASKWARYMGLVPMDALVDHRNPQAIVFANFYAAEGPDFSIDADIEFELGRYKLPELPKLPALPDDLPPVPTFEVAGYENAQQSTLIEVWVEKSTMNDVLEPICRRYGANLVTALGEFSISAVADFLKRVRQANRAARILYISDFDPAGLGMPISVARKIEYCQYRYEQFAELDIRLQPIALDSEQVKRYGLPRVPVKDTDRRKTNFEAAFGAGQVELDALEALYPGVLAGIVDEAFLRYYDTTLQDRAEEVGLELIDRLERERQDILSRYESEMKSLAEEYAALISEFEKTRIEFDKGVAEFGPKIEAHSGRLEELRNKLQEVHGKLLSELNEVEIDGDEFALPEAELPPEAANMLFDSSRGYGEQLLVYKARRSNAA